MASGTWPRDSWLDAMWDDETVKPNERLVAGVYARYAGSSDTTWCPWKQLKLRTGIRSRDTINRAIKGLLAGGWFEEIEPARQHYSARYRLTTPAQPSGIRTPEPDSPVDSAVDNPAQQSGKQTAEPPRDSITAPSSSPFPDTSSPLNGLPRSPFNGPDISNLQTQPQRSKDLGHAAPRPLRTDRTQAPDRTEQDPSPAKADQDQAELISNQQTARADKTVSRRRKGRKAPRSHAKRTPGVSTPDKPQTPGNGGTGPQNGASLARRENELRAVAAMGCPLCDENGQLPGGLPCAHDPPRSRRPARAALNHRKDTA